MPQEQPYTLPVITRDMLPFRGTATFALVIQSRSGLTTPVSIRGATREGTFKLTHTPTSDGELTTETFNIPDIPIWLSVLDDTNAYAPGQIYIRINLAINGDILHQLAGGYVYRNSGITWPETNLKDSLPTLGTVLITTGADPAAGAELSLTVPTNESWLVKGIRFQLITDANVATRRVHVVYTPAAGMVLDTLASGSQIASLTRDYSVVNLGAVTSFTDDNDIHVPLPADLWLPGAATITTVTTNIQATDNFGTMAVWAERYFR